MFGCSLMLTTQSNLTRVPRLQLQRFRVATDIGPIDQHVQRLQFGDEKFPTKLGRLANFSHVLGKHNVFKSWLPHGVSSSCGLFLDSSPLFGLGDGTPFQRVKRNQKEFEQGSFLGSEPMKIKAKTCTLPQLCNFEPRPNFEGTPCADGFKEKKKGTQTIFGVSRIWLK